MTQNEHGPAASGGRFTTTSSTRNAADEEQQPLLNGANGNGNGNGYSSKSTLTSRMRKAAKVEVKRDWADVVLILCYVITGLLDSSSISIWGSFVSMQTGRTTRQPPRPSNSHLSLPNRT